MSPGETIPFDHVLGGRLEEAMSAVLYPDSANTWDSLGEVLLQDGQRARALE